MTSNSCSKREMWSSATRAPLRACPRPPPRGCSRWWCTAQPVTSPCSASREKLDRAQQVDHGVGRAASIVRGAVGASIKLDVAERRTARAKSTRRSTRSVVGWTTRVKTKRRRLTSAKRGSDADLERAFEEAQGGEIADRIPEGLVEARRDAESVRGVEGHAGPEGRPATSAELANGQTFILTMRSSNSTRAARTVGARRRQPKRQSTRLGASSGSCSNGSASPKP